MSDSPYYHPQYTPQFYLPNDESAVEQTPAEKLDEIGRLEVVTSVSAFGTVAVNVADSVTDNYKREARFMATTEPQIDINGLGYKYDALEIIGE